MSNSSSPRPETPRTVWLARGRHAGTGAEGAVRSRLESLTAEGVLHSHRAPEDPDASGARVFEARWLTPAGVTVRARLTLAAETAPASGREWVVAAEAERPWESDWASPAAMFWPQEPGAGWDREAVTGLRLGAVNPLPDDDKELRRLLRHAVRDTWNVHVVVHEAMTPDAYGRLALVRLLPAELRHRVVEHRAAPHRLRAVNWALEDSGVQVPRGGALVLPGRPAARGYEAGDFSVRSVFLDGSEPKDVLDAVRRFAALPRPLPEGGAGALTALREEWRLLTMEEELARARDLVAMYEDALAAMTRSRDLYREAAEHAHEALSVYRDAEAAGTLPAARRAERPAAGSPFQQLARGFERLRGSALSRRPGTVPGPAGEPPRSTAAEPPVTARAALPPGTGSGTAGDQESSTPP
ncbi:hypothetical protein, partial [Streptomyces tropicalis]